MWGRSALPAARHDPIDLALDKLDREILRLKEQVTTTRCGSGTPEVVLETCDGAALAVLPASRRLDMDLVRAATGDHRVRLATEAEIEARGVALPGRGGRAGRCDRTTSPPRHDLVVEHADGRWRAKVLFDV